MSMTKFKIRQIAKGYQVSILENFYSGWAYVPVNRIFASEADAQQFVEELQKNEENCRKEGDFN